VEFWSDEEGQGTVEYILILSVVVLGASQLGRQILAMLEKGILRLGAVLEQDIKTGRAPLSVWEN
jgi:Flp pilus assembly pilin Flp